MSELSNRLRNFRRWNSAHQNYDPVQICLEAADALDTALTRIRELEAKEGQLPETLPDVGYEMLSTLRGHFTGPEHAESGRRAYARLRAALSSKDQEKTNG